MWSENLAYALTQVVHNFGAAAVLGGALAALWPAFRQENPRPYAWLILVVWGAQIASGGLFALTSLVYYGETPDLSRVAITALASPKRKPMKACRSSNRPSPTRKNSRD